MTQSRTVILDNKKVALRENFDKQVLENISWYMGNFQSHSEIAENLSYKNPYTITVLIESLRGDLRNRREFVKKTKYPVHSLYQELLYDEFFKEYGKQNGNEVYGDWLKKSQNKDEQIIAQELEPRYKENILKRYKNHEKLFKERIFTDRKRYYNLPEPLNYVDHRNPFDNIFVWEENGKKVARRGGSGSSQAREINSMFIYGLLELNKRQPVPSYLFMYSEDNKLYFVKGFEDLHVPDFDLGSNYRLDDWGKEQELRTFGKLFRWEGHDVVSKIFYK